MKRNYYLVVLILVTFFVISFLTNIIGPLIPEIIEDFNLSLTLVALLPFAFFIAYGVMSIPSGLLIEKYSDKKVMIAAFLVSFVGALFFALYPNYLVAVISLFLIGTGMAMLQVAINPLLREAGGEEHFAFNSVLGQLFFGAASFLSPLAYSYLVLNLGSADVDNFLLNTLEKVVPPDLPWISLYWLFAVLSLVMVAVIAASPFPTVKRKEDEKIGAWDTHKELFKNPKVWLFFLGIFAYVGSEQGVANWISEFLSTYHGYDPQTTGASTVSWFWGMLTAGTVLGLLLLKVMDSRNVLVFFTIGAIVSLSVALFGSGETALLAFPAVGFFSAVLWSVIFSLALNSVTEHHGTYSGILVSGIVGGAIVPLIIGSLGDVFGLRAGMFFLYITFGYILSIGFWAKPLVSNKTIEFG
ncbi:sugar MFS transporter [Rhodohalobacter sulfatireducens]|uniref:Sugar MFS transporter n=1 Tax=Rhodohalobacter sulfatireducens TaxID=2911366 RepID=A0ABS9KFG8_9BACT|nr:sugar MFS transporter [Rhodohalobacter sulfatireducens]MCG2589609.1 sugar MFS transporter [Rhodohalobacter sulfatireducens]MDR9364706.1 sugar MFS transporter [Balneolaceae bacterium]